MTTKKYKKARKFEFKGFINVDFTDEERDAISVYLAAFTPDPEDSLVVLVEAGYKVSFSWDDYHAVNQVALTCRSPESKYFGYVITFKHADLMRSVSILRYLHDTALRDGLYSIETKTKTFDW